MAIARNLTGGSASNKKWGVQIAGLKDAQLSFKALEQAIGLQTRIINNVLHPVLSLEHFQHVVAAFALAGVK